MKLDQLTDLATEHNVPLSAYFWEWDKMAELQFRFLTAVAKIPLSTKFLDVGCGALRLGQLLIPYLDDDCYRGIDAYAPFVDMGKTLLERQGNTKRYQAVCSNRFDFDVFERKFDVAFAFSVIGQLSREQNVRCFTALKRCMRPGGKFYATVSLSGAMKSPVGFFYGGTNPCRRPSWTDLGFLSDLAATLGLRFEEMGTHYGYIFVAFTFPGEPAEAPKAS